MSRKLQAEIERVFKKVAEGIEEFESCYEKVQNAATASQKEKHEADLKKEIKKLQRMRDQIKAWIQSSDVKDKQDLLHHRKLIEKQMERFKAIEKEMKTKAYSKEGLLQSMKLDPREKQKQDVCNWLVEQVEKLSTQVDVYEAEAEKITSTLGKKKKDHAKLERVKELGERVERHKHHIKCLERIQRLLENESITLEQVQDIQEDVNYYVEENGDEDFVEDEAIYDDLNLDSEELFNVGGDEEEDFESGDEKEGVEKINEEFKDIDIKNLSLETRESTTAKSTGTTPNIQTTASAVSAPNAQIDTKPMRKISTHNLAKSPVAQVVTTSSGISAASTTAAATATATAIPAAAVPVANVVGNVGAAAAAPSGVYNPSSTSITNAQINASVLGPVSSVSQPGLMPIIVPAPIPAHALPQPWAAVASLGVASAGNDSQMNRNTVGPTISMNDSDQQGKLLSRRPASKNALNATKQSKSVVSDGGSAKVNGLVNGVVALKDGVKGTTSVTEPTPKSKSEQHKPATSQPDNSTISQVFANDPLFDPTTLACDLFHNFNPPEPLADLYSVYLKNSEKYAPLGKDSLYRKKLMELSLQSIPTMQDQEEPKPYTPTNPVETPPYYPQSRLDIFTHPDSYVNLGIDTLFFMFYYQKNSRLQLLAARELKKQSWRFHKKYLTWFQRYDEPVQITDDYEEGTYLYFDYEGSWCQRKKSDFRFEYRYLE